MCISVWLKVEMESDIKCGFVCFLRELFLEVNYFKRERILFFCPCLCLVSYILFIVGFKTRKKVSCGKLIEKNTCG